MSELRCRKLTKSGWSGLKTMPELKTKKFDKVWMVQSECQVWKEKKLFGQREEEVLTCYPGAGSCMT